MLGDTRPERTWRFDPAGRVRRARVGRSEWMMLLAAMVLGVVATAWALWPRGDGALIYTEQLPGGRIFECYTDRALLGTAEDPGSAVEPSEQDRRDFERLSADCAARR